MGPAGRRADDAGHPTQVTLMAIRRSLHRFPIDASHPLLIQWDSASARPAAEAAVALAFAFSHSLAFPHTFAMGVKHGDE
jgi:hypothetical protein